MAKATHLEIAIELMRRMEEGKVIVIYGLGYTPSRWWINRDNKVIFCENKAIGVMPRADLDRYDILHHLQKMSKQGLQFKTE